MDNFCMNFANFILGKDVYGPGEYIFGVFDIGRTRGMHILSAETHLNQFLSLEK